MIELREIMKKVFIFSFLTLLLIIGITFCYILGISHEYINIKNENVSNIYKYVSIIMSILIGIVIITGYVLMLLHLKIEKEDGKE